MPVLGGCRGRAFDLRDHGVDAGAVAAAIRSDRAAASRPEGAASSRFDGAASSRPGGPAASRSNTAPGLSTASAEAEPTADAEVDRAAEAEPNCGVASTPTVRCPPPGPVHDRVGVVRSGREYPLRAALAATARWLGYESSVSDELEGVRERLAALDPPAVSLDEERRRVAETETGDELVERVAALRGQLDAARDRGEDPAALEAATERAVADLASRRTERLAAEQSLERARKHARERRDRLEERLELQDRERNLEREARRELATALQGSFERALAAVPGSTTTGARPWQVEDQVAGALAVCRIAPLSAPVVVAVDRFSSARAAAAALDAPVVLVER